MSAPAAPKRAAARTRIAGEHGFTIVEVLAAAIVMVIGAMGVLQVIDTSNRGAFRAEQTQVAINRAEREMEKIRDLTYDKIALTASPAPAAGSNDPRSRVAGSAFALDRDTGGEVAELVVNGGKDAEDKDITEGTVSPFNTFTTGDISGEIYRFVVWQDDPSCVAECPGDKDYKRVVIAVKLDSNAISIDRPYQEVQAEFVDEQTAIDADDSSGGGGGGGGSAENFYLTDTSCNNTTRQSISGDHELHNTLGVCAAGPQTGTEPGAPDLMVIQPPPAESPIPPLYDYATDVEPASDPTSDAGVQILKRNKVSCDFDPGASTMTHRWVTNAFSSPYQLEGSALLTVHTRTLNGSVHAGKLCGYLYYVNSAGGVTFLKIKGFQLNVWPTGWNVIQIGFSFPAVKVPTGNRLGVSWMVDRAGTAGEGLEFAYDHITHPSRLEVSTSTPVSGS